MLVFSIYIGGKIVLQIYQKSVVKTTLECSMVKSLCNSQLSLFFAKHYLARERERDTSRIYQIHFRICLKYFEVSLNSDKMVRCAKAHMTVCVHLMASLIAYLSSPDKEPKSLQKLNTAMHRYRKKYGAQIYLLLSYRKF